MNLQNDAGSPSTGKVLLVGAGPGAVDLLTLRAARAIASADAILHDALVLDEVLALAKPGARLIEVGKRGHRRSTPQDFTNRLMARLAGQGLTVVRLKGGDPSVFGRAAEEREFLENRGIPVEVIPGISTASAAAAAFGFSLTERDVARRVVFATGRTLNGAAGGWAGIDAETTVCLYMACSDIAGIAGAMLANGRDPSTPAVVATDVERPGQSLAKCTLEDLAGWTNRPNGPVFIAIGPAVARAFSPSGVRGLAKAALEAQSAA